MRSAEVASVEAFFLERRFRLRTYEADGKWWTDLVGRPGFKAARYGVGDTAEESILSAKARWDVEQ
jgi:hypothetical protein